MSPQVGISPKVSINMTTGYSQLFADVLEQIKIVVNETDYSADTSGDYKGALVTRVKSLTTGLNGQIFRPMLCVMKICSIKM